jgi:hypothetical protein
VERTAAAAAMSHPPAEQSQSELLNLLRTPQATSVPPVSAQCMADPHPAFYRPYTAFVDRFEKGR